MIWRIFFCCSLSTFTLSFLGQIKKAVEDKTPFSEFSPTLTSASTLKFGVLKNIDVKLSQIHGSLVLGVLGGMLGSLFINVNTRVGRIRKKCITSKWKKVLETGIFAALTVSIMFWATALLNECEQREPTYTAEELALAKNEEHLESQNDWICDTNKNEYSPVATLFFNTERGMIQSLFSADKTTPNFKTLNLLVFGAVWFLMTITTYGVWIPAGLFLPGIIMGGALGRLYTNVVYKLFDYPFDPDEAQ